VEIYADDRGSTGNLSMGVFQILFGGNIWHPCMMGVAKDKTGMISNKKMLINAAEAILFKNRFII
jgi:hypothetical protein